MIATATKLRVVVADDSALMRRIVSNVLSRDGIEIVGTAKNGDEALALCERERPDALSLDLAMPGLGGIDVLKALRRPGAPQVPVVVVSAFSPAAGARAVDALAEGAFELVPKPTGSDDVDVFEQSLLAKVRAAGRLSVRPSVVRRPSAASSATAAAAPRFRRAVATNRHRALPHRGSALRRDAAQVVLIATSTGGPRALAQLIPELPSPLGLGTLIVQHMPAGFTASLASRLDRSSPLTVREAEGGESLAGDVALLAPGGQHLRLGADGAAVLSNEAPLGGLRPRADLLIEDAARRFRERLLLVVLTGMGNDGLRGARAVKSHGGRVFAEAQESCTVYGMPRAVAEADLVDEVAPLDQLASLITREVGR